MQIDVTQPVLDYRGQPLMEDDVRNGKVVGSVPIILRDILCAALGFEDKNRPELVYDIASKQKAYAASVALFASKKVKLKSDVIELLKPRLNALYSPLICGQINELFDDEKRTVGNVVEVITNNDRYALENTEDNSAEDLSINSEKDA